MLSIIIVGYNPDIVKLNKFLRIIGKKFALIYINNSEKYDLKRIKFEKNTKIINSKNYGNGAGINLGLKSCKTQYALYLDIDVLIKKNFFNDLKKYIKKIKNFAILVPNHGNLSSRAIKIEKYSGEASVMLFNLKKFKKIGYFDENYFLYFEEQDLFHQCRKNNLKIYFLPNLKIKHMRASSVSKNLKNIIYLRTWHYMWSMFYFYRKNFNYFFAIKKTIFFLIKDFVMLILFLIILNIKNVKFRFYRIYGLISSIFGFRSFFRL